MALALRPDAVFLLSDGEFPKGTVEAIARENPRKIPIHCIDLTGGLAGDHLHRIARDSGGQYASRPGSLQAIPVSHAPHGHCRRSETQSAERNNRLIYITIVIQWTKDRRT